MFYYRSIERYEIDGIKITVERETSWYLSMIPGVGFFLDMGDICLDGHVDYGFNIRDGHMQHARIPMNV